MKSPLQTATRLLGALEDLVAQEAALIQAGDYGACAAVQLRTAAVGEKLCELARVPAVQGLQPRVEALLSRRRETQQSLARHLAAGRLEFQRVNVARQRLARLAPVYGGSNAPGPRLNAAA